MTNQEMSEKILLCATEGFSKWLEDMDEKYKSDGKRDIEYYDINDVIKQKDILIIAEEFNKWLNDMSEKYKMDKDDIQEFVKQFLM